MRSSPTHWCIAVYTVRTSPSRFTTRRTLVPRSWRTSSRIENYSARALHEERDMVAISSIIAANEKQVAAKVMDGEAILINLGTGIYYSLDGTGGFIWSLVEKRVAIQDIIGSVVDHYDVTPAD